MIRASEANLIKEVTSRDPIGQLVREETSRLIPVRVASVTRLEWAEASKVGVNPQVMLITPSINYEGESIVEFEGQRLYVYRTYTNGGQIELYLERRAGV